MSAPDPTDCKILEWDSRHFGFTIGRIFASRLTRELVTAVDEWRRERQVECVTFLADPADYETTRFAAEYKMFPADVRITLATDALNVGQSQSRVCLRFAEAGDREELKAIAGTAHRDSRFFFDKRFPEERTRALFECWIEKSCSDKEARVLVAEWDGKPAGYAACRLSAEGQGQIDLFAVADWAANHGLGTALLSAALGWFPKADARRALVVTQLRNIRAQRLYQRAGFRILSAEAWYHWWL